MKDSPLALNIRGLRELRHWTQEDLATPSGVDVRTIQRAEAGQPLALESLKALAASFDIDLEVLSMPLEQMERLADDFRKNYSKITLQPLDETTNLRNLAGTGAFAFHTIGTFSDEQKHALAELEQELQDMDEWRELDALQRREMEKRVEDLVRNLRSLGVALSYGIETMNLKLPAIGDLKPVDPNATLRLTSLNVAAVAREAPLRGLIRDKRQGLSFA